MGSAGLHRRLYHAGGRRIPLRQRRRLHLKHMPGLCSSVSTHHHSHDPPCAEFRQAGIRARKLHNPRAHPILRPLPFPHPPRARPHHLCRYLCRRGSSDRQRRLIQFECKSSRKQTKPGARSPQSSLDYPARHSRQLRLTRGVLPSQMPQSQPAPEELEGRALHAVLQHHAHHHPYSLPHRGILLHC